MVHLDKPVKLIHFCFVKYRNMLCTSEHDLPSYSAAIRSSCIIYLSLNIFYVF